VGGQDVLAKFSILARLEWLPQRFPPKDFEAKTLIPEKTRKRGKVLGFIPCEDFGLGGSLGWARFGLNLLLNSTTMLVERSTS